MSGTAGNPITYRNYPGETPVIDRSRILTGWTQYSGSVYWASYSNSNSIGMWEDTFEESGYYCDYWVQDSISAVSGPGKYYRDTNNMRMYVWTSDGSDPDNHVMRTSVGRGGSWDDKDYIVVDGIHIKWVHRGFNLNNVDYSIFNNLDIEYVLAMGFLLGNSNYNQIANNTIFHVGSWYRDEGDGIHLGSRCHHNLIEGNDVSVTAHNPITTYGSKTTTGVGPHHNIIQNNVVHDSGSSGLNPNVDPYQEVWRRNTAYHNTGAGLQTDSNNNIIYNNVFYDNGCGGINVYTVSGRPSGNNKFFNNVVFDNGGWCDHSTAGVEIVEYSGGGPAEYNIFKNNIIHDNDGDYDVWLNVDNWNSKNNIFIHSNIYDPSGTGIRASGTSTYPLSWWEGNHPSIFSNNIDENPLFVNENGADFGLQSGSPCINTGDWLAYTTSADSGTQIPVEDASYFTDGYGITEGDLIQLEGSTQTARITGVDYSSNVLTVDTDLSWSAGEGVGFVYSGSAPDIGAYEYGSGEEVPGDIDGNGKVELEDLVKLAQDFGKTSGFTWPRADTNQDGEIDIYDLVFVASRFT